jgi:two-component system chemotaxis response regulator CheB
MAHSLAHSSIIVIGASAGGVTALCEVAAGLPPDLAAPILIVLHIGAHSSDLPALLNASGPLFAKHGEHGELVEAGVVYVAPPDRHMTIVGDRLRLTRGPKENWARPAIDPLFRSAAEAYGPAAIGVILTGMLNDGTVGLFEIKRAGGIAIAQDPDDAAYRDMPTSAATYVALDYCLPLVRIPALLVELVAAKESAMPSAPSPPPTEVEADTSGQVFDRPLTVTCPECGGALRRTELGPIVKFDCHIGHSYTAEIMAEAQFGETEKIMRAAVRCLSERAEFCRLMAERSPTPGVLSDAETWRAASREALERAYAMRDLVEQDWIKPDSPPRPVASTGKDSPGGQPAGAALI